MQKKSVSLAKSIPIAFVVLTGCALLVPTGLLGTTPQSEVTNRPTETPSDIASAMQSQTPGPNMSPLPISGSSSSPSAGVAVTPAPSASSKPTATPTLMPEVTPEPSVTRAPTPTPTPYAVSVVITPESSTMIHVGYGEPHIAPYVEINPTTVKLNAVVTLSDTSTNSSVTWSTSDSGIARLYAGDRSLVTGQSVGVADITATSRDGKASSSISVTVQSGGIVDVIVE